MENSDLIATEIADESATIPGGEERAGVEVGATLGRYVIVERLGAGAMGVVYAAYDPELDRKVAIKLVLGRGSEERAERLLREARSLAQLAHPNVVAIHDVGRHGTDVFLAMELVDGSTLGEWLGERERGWRQVLPGFIDAGRGLAAAHAVGLVHRDFKPDNVMVGGDGRVRVMDFGLARAESVDDADEAGDAPSSEAVSMTRTGALIGTPAYMAPEQFAGSNADARSDQFSFCAALHEALYGQRPFEGDTIAQLSLAVLEGRRRTLPASRRVPARLRKLVDRGLAVQPETRHASLDVLVGEFETLLAGGRRGWVTAIGLGGALTLAFASRGDEADPPCVNVGSTLDATWSPARADDLRERFTEVSPTLGAETAARAVTMLEAWAARWRESRVDACEDTRVRHEQSPELLDLRMACLDRRRASFAATVEVLLAAEADVVPNALEAVRAVDPLEPCEDLEGLRAGVPPPEDPETRDAVDAIDDAIERSSALRVAGRYEDASIAGRAALERALATEYRPVVARAQTHLAAALGRLAQYDEALELDRAAFQTAVEVGDDPLAARVSRGLAFRLGIRVERHDPARVWGEVAEALTMRTDPGGPGEGHLRDILGGLARARGELDLAEQEYGHALRIHEGLDEDSRAGSLSKLGAIAYHRGHFDDAQGYFSRALEIRTRTLGLNHPTVAAHVNNLGLLASGRGEYETALEYLQRAKKSFEAGYGADHPHVASALLNIGIAQHHLERDDEARASYEEALALYVARLGPEHPDVADAHNNLATLLHRQGKHDEALHHHEAALAIRRGALDEGHHDIANSLGNIAMVQLDLDRVDEAEANLREALRIQRAGVGEDNPATATFLASLGNVARTRGDLPKAQALHQQALDIRLTSLGKDHDGTGSSWENLGTLASEAGDLPLAIERYEEALRIAKRYGERSTEVADRMTAIAGVHLDADRPDEALELARDALTIHLEHEHPKPREVSLTRWVLARAMWRTGERTAGTAEAREALAGAPERLRLEIEAWLSAPR